MHPSHGLSMGLLRSPLVTEHLGQPRGLTVRSTASVVPSYLNLTPKYHRPQSQGGRCGPVPPCGDHV